MPIKLSCVENPELNTESMSFAQCVKCNTIQLDNLIPLNILYSSSHNYTSVGKIWDGYFNLFSELVTPIVLNKIILEIGDPSGKIANRINGFDKWYIIEPNKNLNINFKPNIEVIEEFFDSNFTTDKKIDIIVHSHLFEHIYEPNQFLTKCYELLTPNGEIFFGVPNMEHIGTNALCPFLGIFFEHTVFLNKQNITYLLESNGFKVLDIYDYLSHSTLYHAKKINKTNQFNLVPINNFKNLFIETLDNYINFINNTNNIIISSNLPVYIFGASYNSQIILALGININKIVGILDNCIDKHNKYLYGYNLKIYNPQILKDINSIVILKNGYYIDEIKSQILDINPNTIILS
jgi:SAM-dependent methyltransferase